MCEKYARWQGFQQNMKGLNIKGNTVVCRCAAHLLNLMTCDILKHPIATKVFKDCLRLVNAINKRPKVKCAFTSLGGSINAYVATRWLSAHKLFMSILQCAAQLLKIGSDYSDVLGNAANLMKDFSLLANIEKITKITLILNKTVLVAESDSSTIETFPIC